MLLKIVTIIQARTGSSRLPRKVLLYAAGEPLLIHMVNRVKKAKLTGTVVVATTENSEDDVIVDFCNKNNIECFRGDENNLLDRHYQAAKKYDADIVLKIPSDCPLIDPIIIDEVIQYYLDNINNYDFVSNLRPPTHPDGNDVEVMSFEALEYAWENAELEHEKEHTTPYIWNNTDKFRIGNVTWSTGLNYSETHRWTLDYEEDYTFIREVYNNLYKTKPNFGIYEILNLIENKPYISSINKQHTGKFWYKNNNKIKSKINLQYE